MEKKIYGCVEKSVVKTGDALTQLCSDLDIETLNTTPTLGLRPFGERETTSFTEERLSNEALYDLSISILDVSKCIHQGPKNSDQGDAGCLQRFALCPKPYLSFT